MRHANASESASALRACTPPVRLRFAAWCCTLGLACPAAAQVAVVSRVPADRAVLEQLAGMLDEPVHDRPEPVPRGLAAIIGDAQHWPERYVVVIDRMEDSVHVLRPSDQTIVSRVLAAEVLADSHYAVALATAELLEWLGAAPRAETAVDVAHAPRAAPQPVVPPTAEASGMASAPEEIEPALPEIGVAIGAGLQLSASPGADISLARLAGDAELQLGRGLRSPWFAFGLRVAAPASLERALDPKVGGTGVARVEYASSELALHAAIGTGTRGAALAVGPVAGLAFVDVTARGAGGAQIGAHDAKAGMVGAGVWLRYPLAWGLGLGLAAEAQWLLSPERYRVAGQRVLQDGSLRLQTQLGLVWESALAPL